MASIFKHGRRWRAQVRIKGKAPVSDIFETKNDAIVWARQKEADLHKSKSTSPLATFAEILDVYEKNSRKGGSTKQSILKHLRAYWGTWRIAEIHSGTVTDFVKTGKGVMYRETDVQDWLKRNVVPVVRA
jgi:hypothetical protein